jgi:hypothetical protein
MQTREERLAAAKARSEENFESKDSGGFRGKQLLDLSKFGGWKKEMFYRPKTGGMNHVDFIPYIVTTDKHPKKLRKGEYDYVLDVWVHRFVGASKGTFLCLSKMYGKPCPICEERERLERDPGSTKKEIDSLKPKHRCIYNVINTDLPEREQKVQLFDESHYLFEDKLLTIMKVKNEFTFWDYEDGKNIEFMASEKTSPEGKHNDYGQFYFLNRKPYPESICKEAFPLDEMLNIPTYDEVKIAFLSLDSEEFEGEPERPREPETKERDIRDDIREETKDIYADSPRRERVRRDPEPENECPFGHVFGEDNEKFIKERHCTKCDQEVWNKCAALFDKINAKRG